MTPRKILEQLISKYPYASNYSLLGGCAKILQKQPLTFDGLSVLEAKTISSKLMPTDTRRTRPGFLLDGEYVDTVTHKTLLKNLYG